MGQYVVMLSSQEGLSSFYRDADKAFTNDIVNIQMLKALGIHSNLPFLYELVDQKLFPILSKHLSKRGLPQFCPSFNRTTYEHLKSISESSPVGWSTVAVSSLVNNGVYKAICQSVFGPIFPLGSFHDFKLIDADIPLLLSGIPFLGRSAKAARKRLYASLNQYIEQKQQEASHPCDIDDFESSPSMVSEVLHQMHASNLNQQELSGLLLDLMWGLISNTIRTTFWLLVYLVQDPAQYKQLRLIIDKVTSSYAFEDMISADPKTFDGPDFHLLDSAILETIRLMVLSSSIRRATKDTHVCSKDGKLYVVKSGELVMGDVYASHHDKDHHNDPGLFMIDRFVDSKASSHVFPWGGGLHMVCCLNVLA